MKALEILVRIIASIVLLFGGIALIAYLTHIGHTWGTNVLPEMLGWSQYDPAFFFLGFIGFLAAAVSTCIVIVGAGYVAKVIK